MNPEHALELCVWSETFLLLVMPSLYLKEHEEVQFKAFAEPKSLIRREPLFSKKNQSEKVEQWFSHCQKCYQRNDTVNLKPILFLVGPPGVGKTFCIERAAALQNILVREIDMYEKPTSSVQDSISRGSKNREKCVVIKLEEIGLTWSLEMIKMIVEMVTAGKTIVPMVFEVTNEEAFRRQKVNNREQSLYSLFSKQKYCEWVAFYPNSPYESTRFCEHYFKTLSRQRVVSAHGDLRQLRIQMEWFGLGSKSLNKEEGKETFYSNIEVCEWMMKQKEKLTDINILTDFMEIGRLTEFCRNALLFLHSVKPFKPPYLCKEKNGDKKAIVNASNNNLFQLLLRERRKQLFHEMEDDQSAAHEILQAQENVELSGMMHMTSTGLWNSLINFIIGNDDKTTQEEIVKVNRSSDFETMDRFAALADVSSDFDLNPYFIEQEYLEAKALACVSIMEPVLFQKRNVAYKDMLRFLQPLSVYANVGSSVFVSEEKKTEKKVGNKKKRKR